MTERENKFLSGIDRRKEKTMNPDEMRRRRVLADLQKQLDALERLANKTVNCRCSPLPSSEEFRNQVRQKVEAIEESRTPVGWAGIENLFGREALSRIRSV